MSDAPFLQATGLHKTYHIGARALEVLKGVDLGVARGEFVALRGASGAGKSTLLHLLGGLDTPDAGDVVVAGQSLNQLKPGDLARFRNLKAGFIFQAYHLLPEFDALENVCLPARMARRDPAETEAQGRALLTRVGLGERMDHRPAELSGGEQQRVAIARALINNPVLLLADEPTGNLDSENGDGILKLLAELRTERALTLVIATHEPRVAAAAGRVVQLVDGRLAEKN